MRVIGGRSRGRRLVAPLPKGVRPTSDRVRESIFDILFSLAGGLDGLVVADLCCGTGAMGVEALSRGAAAVTFVDHDPVALSAVAANLAAVGLGDEPATMVRADVVTWAARSEPVDVALCDPPYAFDRWADLLGHLQAGLVVAESGDAVPAAAGWSVVRDRRYGGTLVTVLQPETEPTTGADGPGVTRPHGVSGAGAAVDGASVAAP